MRGSRLARLAALADSDDPRCLRQALKAAIDELTATAARTVRLNRLIEQVGQARSIQGILDVLWARTGELITFDRFMVCRRVGERWRLHPRGSAADDPGPRMRPGYPLSLVLETGQADSYADIEFEGERERCGSMLVVPLMTCGEIAGALAFGADARDAFDVDDLHVALTVAFHLAPVLNNARRQGEVLRLSETLALAEAQRREALLNTMPEAIADELLTYGAVTPRRVDACTVVVVGLVDFADASMAPAQLLDELGHVLEGFDRILARHGLVRLNALGETYVFAVDPAGPRRDHARVAVQAARELVRFMQGARRTERRQQARPVRVGVHSGPVVAGVAQRHHAAFDVWSETPRVAARLERSCPVGYIHLSAETRRLLGAGCAAEPMQPSGIADAAGEGQGTFVLRVDPPPSHPFLRPTDPAPARRVERG